MDKTTKDAWLGKSESLSPEALEKRRKINRKVILFGCLPILLSAFVALFLTFSGDESTSLPPIPSPPENQTHIQYIPGLSPVDVYLNLEKQGFNTEDFFDAKHGNLWISKYSIPGIDYRVDTFSYNAENVVSVSATAMVDVGGKDIVATKQFFQFVSTLPYKNANPEEAASWVDKNFNNNGATTEIGGVTFIMTAPTQYVRMLRVEMKYEGPTEELELNL